MAGRPTTFPGTGIRQLKRRHGVRVLGRVAAAEGDAVLFENGARLRVTNVVWATGYHSDFSWIEAPVLDEAGSPVHRRGVTASPGLFFLGLKWQHTIGSALLGWVERDAEFIAAAIRRDVEERAA